MNETYQLQQATEYVMALVKLVGAIGMLIAIGLLIVIFTVAILRALGNPRKKRVDTAHKWSPPNSN